jgi:hypothetical protein
MQIRVLYPVVNIGMTIASLLLLIVGLPCQIGGGETRGSVSDTVLTVLGWDLERPLADDEFILNMSATVTAELSSPTAIVTNTRFAETPQVGTSTEIATDVGRVEIMPVSLLTGLARDKPSIWGSKGFYVLLGFIYVTLLGLFIKQIISIAGSGREQR